MAAIVVWQEARVIDAKEGSVRAIGQDPATVLRSLLKDKPPSPVNRYLAASILLDFEGIDNLSPVGDYYNGVGGPNYGVSFGSSASVLVDSDADAEGGSIANEPSPSTVLWLSDNVDAVMSYSAGFTGLSLKYGSFYDTTLTLYDSPGGTGNVLATATLPATGVCDYDGSDPCGDPTGQYGLWVSFMASFSGFAKSVRFTGDVYHMVLDDVVITTANTCKMTTYWLWNPKTNALVRELVNNSASCIAVPYNIEVRPCLPPKTTPVYLSLQNATAGGITTQLEYYSPFYLWGDTTATGDVYPNKKPLPPGTFYLNSRIDNKVEKIKFTQTC